MGVCAWADGRWWQRERLVVLRSRVVNADVVLHKPSQKLCVAHALRQVMIWRWHEMLMGLAIRGGPRPSRPKRLFGQPRRGLLTKEILLVSCRQGRDLTAASATRERGTKVQRPAGRHILRSNICSPQRRLGSAWCPHCAASDCAGTLVQRGVELLANAPPPQASLSVSHRSPAHQHL